MKRISYKILEEKVSFINTLEKGKVSVHKSQGCGVWLVIDGKTTKNMQNKEAYSELEKIAKPLIDKWLEEHDCN